MRDFSNQEYQFTSPKSQTRLVEKREEEEVELASEFESNLPDTVDLGRKCFAEFNTGKIQLVSFDWSNNAGAIDRTMDRAVLEEKSSFIFYDAGVNFVF